MDSAGMIWLIQYTWGVIYLGRLYWVQSRNGEENLSLGCEVYKKILSQKENVIFLSSRETRKTKRDTFDTETTEKAWEQSANRDMRMIRYLTEQDIDVVYCSSREFQETMEWVEKEIKEVEFVSGKENGSCSEEASFPYRSAGTMYWVTGLSGAGKTTIGTILYHRMKKEGRNILLLDGDMFRDAMDTIPDYSREGREAICFRNLPMTKLLLDCGLSVVNCTIAMIESVRMWNREHMQRYVEIYLEVPMRILEERDSKGLYAGVQKGLVKDVVGVDQEAEFPQNPDIKILNDGTLSPNVVADKIWNSLEK